MYPKTKTPKKNQKKETKTFEDKLIPVKSFGVLFVGLTVFFFWVIGGGGFGFWCNKK